MRTIKNIWEKIFGKKKVINTPILQHHANNLVDNNDEMILEKWASLGFLERIEEKQELSLLLEELSSKLVTLHTHPTRNWHRRLHQLEWDKACHLIFPCIIKIFRGTRLQPEDTVTRQTNISVTYFMSYFFDFYWRHGIVGRNNIFGEYERIDIEAEFCSYLVDCYLGLSEERDYSGATLDLYRKGVTYFIKKHRFIK